MSTQDILMQDALRSVLERQHSAEVRASGRHVYRHLCLMYIYVYICVSMRVQEGLVMSRDESRHRGREGAQQRNSDVI